RTIYHVLQRLSGLMAPNLAQHVARDGLGRGFGCVVWRNDDSWVAPEWTRLRQRLGLENIERGRIQLAGIECSEDVGFNLQPPAPRVDENGARQLRMPSLLG